MPDVPMNETPQQDVPTRRRKRRRRRGRYGIYYLLVIVIAVILGVVLSRTVFFKIKQVSIDGSARYQSQAVLEASGIRVGDNLLKVDKEQARKGIIGRFPYIEDCVVEKDYPDAVLLHLSEAVPFFAVRRETDSVLLSKAGRVLEFCYGAPPETAVTVVGVELEDPVLCESVPADANESVTMLRYLSQTLEELDFSGITYIDLTDRLNMWVIYKERIRIELGSESNLRNKLSFAKYAIENKIDEDFVGIVDVTISKQVRYRKGNIWEHPKPQIQPGFETPEPEEEAPEEETQTEE